MSPVVQQREIVGFVRNGYFRPTLAIGYSQVPLLAALALPVFLLAPLFYYVVRKELKPLNDASKRLSEVARDITVHPSSDSKDFISRFNQFVDGLQENVRNLEGEQ
ncbi:MAG: hypothetical protein ACI915_001915 [Gammaproteobacteria bacterium]|jgi:hypothetical protein